MLETAAFLQQRCPRPRRTERRHLIEPATKPLSPERISKNSWRSMPGRARLWLSAGAIFFLIERFPSRSLRRQRPLRWGAASWPWPAICGLLRKMPAFTNRRLTGIIPGYGRYAAPDPVSRQVKSHRTAHDRRYDRLKRPTASVWSITWCLPAETPRLPS